MDLTEAPTSIDGDYPHVLIVRDLGTGKQLLALPPPGQTHQAVIDALRALFAAHGAPLVLKSDQGSAFLHAKTQAMLDDYGVLQLLSPPRTPKLQRRLRGGHRHTQDSRPLPSPRAAASLAPGAATTSRGLG